MVLVPLLEKIFLFVMVVAKEGDSISHHPDVASAAVVVRFVPLTILLRDSYNQGDYAGNLDSKLLKRPHSPLQEHLPPPFVSHFRCSAFAENLLI